MSNKIEELKKQCRVDKHWDNDRQLWIDGYTDLDMFARLMVLESAKAIEMEVNNWRQLAPFNDLIKQRGVFAIKNHFGVK